MARKIRAGQMAGELAVTHGIERRTLIGRDEIVEPLLYLMVNEAAKIPGARAAARPHPTAPGYARPGAAHVTAGWRGVARTGAPRPPRRRRTAREKPAVPRRSRGQKGGSGPAPGLLPAAFWSNMPSSGEAATVSSLVRRTGAPRACSDGAKAVPASTGSPSPTASSRPHSSACWAPMLSPAIITMALWMPTRRGSRCVPSEPGNNPSLTSGKPS